MELIVDIPRQKFQKRIDFLNRVRYIPNGFSYADKKALFPKQRRATALIDKMEMREAKWQHSLISKAKSLAESYQSKYENPLRKLRFELDDLYDESEEKGFIGSIAIHILKGGLQ